MRIHAFQGTRYGPGPPEPGRLAAPPYDQIDDRLRDELHREPFSFAQLTRSVAAEGLDPHERAAALLRRWRTDGAVIVDQEPSLYPYEIELSSGGSRLGLAALVGLEDPASGVIRPHELTVAKTVEERLGLLRATETDLGPVLMLAEDDGALDEMVALDLANAAPLAEHVDRTGNVHRLFRVSNRKRIGEYQRRLAASAGLIADGHHRYTVASLYAAETAARPGSAAAAKLAVVTSLGAAGLQIDPIHRGLVQPVGLDSPTAAVGRRVPWQGSSGSLFAEAVAAAEQPAIGIVATGSQAEIWSLDPATGPAELPEAASRLTVVLLHYSLLPSWGLAADAAVDGTVLYRSDPDELWDRVASGELATGFFLPPMSGDGFAGAIARGDVLPPKSTRFLPKVVSGLVWAGHDSTLL
jgi:uncharacterized protein (DUF1015 family)